jgi:hypothetical protein
MVVVLRAFLRRGQTLVRRSFDDLPGKKPRLQLGCARRNQRRAAIVMRLRGARGLKMNRLLGTYQRTTGRSPGAFLRDSEIAAAEARVREQEAHVLRLIVQGAPTQMAEDVLRHLTAAAAAVRVRKGLTHL